MSNRTRSAALFARIVAVALAGLLAACSTTGDVEVVDRSLDDDDARSPRRSTPSTSRTTELPAPTYVVKSGDTLFSIAFRHGVDVRDVVRWNGIADPNRILVGQRLTVGEARVVARQGSSSRAPSREDASARVRSRDGGVASDRSVARNDPPRRTGNDPRGSKYPPRQRSDRGARHEAERESRVVDRSEPARAAAEPRPLRDGEVEVRGLDDGQVTTQLLVAAPARSTDAAGPSPGNAATSPGTAASTSATAAPSAGPSNSTAPSATPPVTLASAPAPATTPPTTPATPKPIEPGASRTANGVAWRWPVRGAILQRYAAGDPARQGIDIRGNAGDAVAAAADGEVVYSGNGLLGYGELVIVKHSETFLSAYAHNRARLVKEGDRVKAGQQIAELGSKGTGVHALHFEIRQNGKPVDPLNFLPKP